MAELADYVALPVDFLRSLGCSEGISGIQRSKCVDISYTNRNGEELAVRKRLRIAGEPRMVWRRGDHVAPYGLSRLDAARAGSLHLVEGESDAWTCWYNGVPALGLPGASTWREEWVTYLEGIEKVFVWREPDQGGDTLTSKVRQSDLPNVYIVEAPAGIKDLSSLWHACGHDAAEFRARLGKLLDTARPAHEINAEALTKEARELKRRCAHLLTDPELMARIEEAIIDTGYVGDTTAPLLTYVALSSRLLERPLNLHLQGPSAAGKNRAVDAALDLMPSSAYHLEKAGSARSLIYSKEDFEHRTVVVAEADSLPQDDGPAASAIRSLAEDAYMTYDVVELDPLTGENHTRRITKQGPTGLITTSTRPLREQLSTRTLTHQISDSPEQTRAVLRAHAALVNGAAPKADVAALVDLQSWLALAGDRDVTIPYSVALAMMVPATQVRMRRDFRQLLTAIQAIALLHQEQRDRDEHGRIVSTLDDFELARRLVLSSFTTATSDGVSGPVRETVAALQSIHDDRQEQITVKKLGDRLGLSLSTTSYRVKNSVALGFIINMETRKGQPARLVPGDPLPEDMPPLPTVEELSACVCGPTPENGSTVQPEAPETANANSDSDHQAVEDTVEGAVQPDFHPTPDSYPDSTMGAVAGPVERLNADPEDAPTRPTAVAADQEIQRAKVLAAVEQAGFPRLAISPMETVQQGMHSWAKFIKGAPLERLARAEAALSMVDSLRTP